MLRRAAGALLWIAFAGGAAGVLAGDSAAASTSKPPDGKALFLAQRCDRCHALPSADIKPKGLIKGAPILSERIAKLDPKALARYLRKEVPRNNRKHPIAFEGGGEDLATLIRWIQKQPRPAKAD
jgi:mono/diheme cytochrome c family protein